MRQKAPSARADQTLFDSVVGELWDKRLESIPNPPRVGVQAAPVPEAGRSSQDVGPEVVNSDGQSGIVMEQNCYGQSGL